MPNVSRPEVNTIVTSVLQLNGWQPSQLIEHMSWDEAAVDKLAKVGMRALTQVNELTQSSTKISANGKMMEQCREEGRAESASASASSTCHDVVVCGGWHSCLCSTFQCVL